MNSITHLTVLTRHKMTKPLDKLDKVMYDALPFKKMKNGEIKEIDVPKTPLKLKMQKLKEGCYFIISKNGKVVTENYLFRERNIQLQQIVGDIEIEENEIPLLVTVLNIEGMKEAYPEMILLAYLEFCAAQIIYENPD